jgi:uncharacterized protein YggU (UPF0235/DUF167 family)
MSPFVAAANGVTARIRLTPGASANRIAGLVAEADGGVALKVTVTAVAEDGKANAALIDLLARRWHLAKRDLALIAGATSRRKLLHITGEAAPLLLMLERSIAEPLP